MSTRGDNDGRRCLALNESLFAAPWVLAASLASVATWASCLPLSTHDLQALDAETERRPEWVIDAAKTRLAAATGRPGALGRAELDAVIADAYTEQSQPDEARAAIAAARTELLDAAPSPDVGRLHLRLDLLDDQILIATSRSALAVAATDKLLAGLAGDTLERACTLSVQAIAYDYLHQPDRAVGDALIAFRIAQGGNWLNAKLEAAGTLARVFGGASLYPQAERMIDVVIAIAKADDKTALLSTAEYERAMILVKARRFPDARAALAQSNVYALAVNDRFAIAANNAAICWALVREGNFDEADRVCSEGDADLAAGHREDLATQLIGNRAHLDLERHRPEAALAKLDRIITPALHSLLPGSEPQIYWDRARALQALHRLPEAYSDLVRMHDLEVAADSAQRNQQVAVLSALVSSEDQAAAKRELEKRMDLQRWEIARQKEQRTIVSISALVVSMLLGYLLWLSRRHGRELERQEIILRSAGQNAPDAFLLLDEQRRVRFANRSLCGRGRPPAVGELVSATLPAALVPALTAAIDEAFGRRAVINFTATLTDSDATPRRYDICVVPAVEHERVIGATLRAIDVTDQQEIERRVVDGASQERQRLSSELHEGVGQQLAGVLLLLGNATSAVRRGLPGAGALLEEIAGYVQEGIDAIRELARGLAPVRIGMGSLTVALRRLEFDAARRLRLKVECDCRLDGIELSDLAADHLYCICREAVTNCALHGRSTRLAIVVRADADELSVAISDDGTGISPSGPDSPGLGTKMMAYRMRLLGGECKVTATPNGGTTVLAVVPLARVTA